MRLVKYSHACVRIETDDAVLVVDPGTFTERAALDGADAVLFTHEHIDHVDVDALADELGKRPAVRVFTHAAVIAGLGDIAELATAVTSGEEFEAAGLPVRAYGGLHAEIYRELPRVPNFGYLIDNSIFHPGDSFDVPVDAAIETLFVPISGPWVNLTNSVDFVRAVAPTRAVALHDGLLSDAGLGVYNRQMAGLSGCDYYRLGAGEVVPI